MLRVHLEVYKVGLRVKENIQILVAIKKGQQNFFLSKTAKLNKCVAQINTQTDFFIQQNDPNFILCIMIPFQQNRKFVGMYVVNLGNYQQDSNIFIQKHLQKSPDSEAYIVFQFRYTTTKYQNKNKPLIQISQLELNCMKGIQSQIQQKNSTLFNQNQMLNEKLQILKKENNHLSNNKQFMNDYEDYRMRQESSGQGIQDQSSMSEEKRTQIKDKMDIIREYSRTHQNQQTQKQVFEIFKKQ